MNEFKILKIKKHTILTSTLALVAKVAHAVAMPNTSLSILAFIALFATTVYIRLILIFPSIPTTGTLNRRKIILLILFH